ncbi:MAG: DUF6950 family protein [Sphingobium sp.]|jgi:hypothetical protein
MNPLQRRKKATQATMDRFAGKAFAFGSVDCAKMAAFHLKQLGVKVRLSRAGQYGSAAGAAGALRRLGFATLVEAVDGTCRRLPSPAYAMIGDLVSFPSDHAIGALGIVLGNGNMLAFHEDHDGPVVMTMGRIDIAWAAI